MSLLCDLTEQEVTELPKKKKKKPLAANSDFFLKEPSCKHIKL